MSFLVILINPKMGYSSPMLKRLIDKWKYSSLPKNYIPQGDEAYMSKKQLLYFKRKLEIWRADILNGTVETLEHLKNEDKHNPDIADRATMETERSLELRTRDRQRKLINKIDEALDRIEMGNYGYCEETSEPIGIKRLLARPIATLSIEAQERHELEEKIYSQD